ncbi:hypothetical protein J2T07_002719 [Luteibacter jiangsuensis]|uniref:DUF3077 family protein n=1 Tax=Luteibacter jiangsuensis TaxID=637577 RepID=A0ABT9SZT7_9GAMM|nr:hypothetical protein [Luteibacter jiangsuensis]MDQ0010529.1 hypothetical protein [Luteibacter jiangsuensis]
MGNESAVAKVSELFSFNGKYSIPDENRPHQLLNDASNFLSSAIEIFLGEIEGIDCLSRSAGDLGRGQRLWGAYHLFQMAQGTVDAANSRLGRTRGGEGQS